MSNKRQRWNYEAIVDMVHESVLFGMIPKREIVNDPEGTRGGCYVSYRSPMEEAIKCGYLKIIPEQIDMEREAMQHLIQSHSVLTSYDAVGKTLTEEDVNSPSFGKLWIPEPEED